MKRLSEYLPNVVVSTREWIFDSSGHNITQALLNCLRLLTVPEKRWEYVALLQNHDVAIKTNQEMVQIYRWLNGANDVDVKAGAEEGNRSDLQNPKGCDLVLREKSAGPVTCDTQFGFLGWRDLADKMAIWPHLFANKLMPENHA
uniref:Uncharacterized protein n=1 Tax=Globodera rostochiensis TaxID=31243 RepID=A0A914I421_GLORO